MVQRGLTTQRMVISTNIYANLRINLVLAQSMFEVSLNCVFESFTVII